MSNTNTDQDPAPPRTKREFAVEVLRKAIRSGRYAPGQPLRQVQLMEDLGLGSTPVREAILELLTRGLLVQESHRSVRVADLDRGRLTDIYRVRALVEMEAVRLATAKISDGGIAAMKRLLDAMHRSQAAGDLTSVAEADFAFHRTLYRAADNPVLLDVIDQLWTSFPGNILWNIPGRVQQSLKEHDEILGAVIRRDPSAAAYAIEKHLLTGLSALESHIADGTES
jgi:DNA-binding GntR family transcriptional regulator